MINIEYIRNKWRIDRLNGDTKLDFFPYFIKKSEYTNTRREYERQLKDRHRPNYYKEYRKGIRTKRIPDNREYSICNKCELAFLKGKEIEDHIQSHFNS